VRTILIWVHEYVDFSQEKRIKQRIGSARSGSPIPPPKECELFAFLKKKWLETSISRAEEGIGDYPFWTHPDLIERFRNLAPSIEVIQGSAYGHVIMGNSSGLVFAWAGGMNQIFLRLPRDMQARAVGEIGRYDPTYGDEWIEFRGFGERYGTRVNSEEALPRWIQIAYEESLKPVASASS